MTKLNTELNNANWARVYNELNPNTSYEIFIEILNSHIDECLPWKKLNVRTETNEWLTKGHHAKKKTAYTKFINVIQQ